MAESTEPTVISADEKRRRQSVSLRQTVVRITRASLVVLLLLAGAVAYLYHSAQQLPEFYQAALAIELVDQQVAGDQFETEVLQLQNSARNRGHWQANFSEQEVNGWLASDLPEKFPTSFPPTISDPRVHLAQDEIQLAFRFESRRLSGIVVVTGDLFCTDVKNEVAVRIKSIRSGMVPLPLKPWIDDIATGLRRAGCSIDWTEDDGDPVALITLPTQLTENSDRSVVLEAIQMEPGHVRLAGTTGDPIYKTASAEADDESPENSTENR